MPSIDDHLRWLEHDRSLEELQERFPDEWRRVRARLIEAGEQGRSGLDRLLADLTPTASGPADRALPRSEQLRRRVQRRMVQLTLGGWSDRAESGVEEGRIAFDRFNAALLQRVLFSEGLTRKPVRMVPFRAAWRLASQRDRLMPIVRQQGIYCFYSAPFIREVVRIAAGRTILEIGAGDGTLTRMLRAAGGDAIATDDRSWAHVIDYPTWVEEADARTALRRHGAPVVICSWPPAGNRFEREVLADPRVQTYIAVVSRDPREAGAPDAYAEQTAFTLREVDRLHGLVLPPGRNRVLVFDRRDD